MNLWLRIILLLIMAPFRARLVPPLDVSRLKFHVWPNDLDTNLHMNNGRYLTIMDLGRFDLTLRMGFVGAARRNKWIPILSAAKVRFRRELRLFQPYWLETRIVWWSGSQFVIEHRIIITGKSGEAQTACMALVLGGIYQRAARRFVPVEELMREMNVTGQSPAPTSEVEAFLAAEAALKKAS